MLRNELTFPHKTFLGRIDDQSWEQLSSLWTVRRYAPRTLIISAEDNESSDVFFVIDGTVRATVYTDAGREVSFLSFSNGDCIGEFSALDEAPRSSDVVAEKESLVARLSAEQFRAVVKTNPNVSYALLMLMIGNIRRLSKRVVDFNAKTADQRLRTEILNLAKSRAGNADEVIIDRPPTQSQMASVVFSSRESVAREMGQMRKAGVAFRIKRSLHIPSIKKFESYMDTAAP